MRTQPDVAGAFLAAFLTASVSGGAHAQDLSTAREEITEFADAICLHVEQSGQETAFQVTGEANAKLSGLLDRFGRSRR